MLALRRVVHFRVELQAVDGAVAVADGGDRASVGAGERHEIAVHDVDLIAVAHPDGGFQRHIGKQVGAFADRLRDDVALSAAELPALGRMDLAAEQVGGELHSVADAEYGDVEIEDGGVAVRGVGSVDAGRTAGQDEAGRFQLGDARGGQVVAHDLAKDVLLADAPGDELAILRAEVEDQDAFSFGLDGHCLEFLTPLAVNRFAVRGIPSTLPQFPVVCEVS